jgi:hypothetical protein
MGDMELVGGDADGELAVSLELESLPQADSSSSAEAPAAAMARVGRRMDTPQEVVGLHPIYA